MERLASEILDVAKIADHTLTLKKEFFSLGEIISDAIVDFRQQIKQNDGNNKLKLIYEFKDGQGENDNSLSFHGQFW